MTDPGHGHGTAIVMDRPEVARRLGKFRGSRHEGAGPDARDEEREPSPGAGGHVRRIHVREPALAVMSRGARHRASDAGAPGRQDGQQERRGPPGRQAAGSPSGSSTMNEAPPSTQFSARSAPPSSVTMPYETDSPRPLPSPGGFVVKNGSKTLGSTSGAIPGPESRTSTQACRSDGQTRTVSTRCAGCLAIPWCAFWTRLSSTCWCWFSSVHTNGHEGKSVTTRMLSCWSWYPFSSSTRRA